MNKRLINIFLTLVTATLVMSCGGGGGSPGVADDRSENRGGIDPGIVSDL